MDKKLEEIYRMLDWSSNISDQKAAIEMGKTFKDYQCFILPTFNGKNKSMWDNCAQILCSKSDKELQPNLNLILVWLQDLNWPGAPMILSRLEDFSTELLLPDIETCLDTAEESEDIVWTSNLTSLVLVHLHKLLDICSSKPLR